MRVAGLWGSARALLLAALPGMERATVIGKTESIIVGRRQLEQTGRRKWHATMCLPGSGERRTVGLSEGSSREGQSMLHDAAESR
jgi:hypothetical protein